MPAGSGRRVRRGQQAMSLRAGTAGPFQRLLRGRLLYVAFAAVLLPLYAGALLIRPPAHEPPAPAVASREAEVAAEDVWWKRPLGPEEIEAALQDPVLSMATGLLMAFSVLMGVGGIILSLRACVTGRVRETWRARPRAVPAWSLGELARITMLTCAIAVALPFLAGAVVPPADGAEDPHAWMAGSMLVLDLGVAGIIWLFATGKRLRGWRAVGLSARDAGRAVRVGLGGYMAMFPWLFGLLFLIIEVTRWLGIEPPTEPIQELLFEEQRPGILGLTIFLACFVGPVAEELFFRGVLYSAVRHRSSRAVAMLVSGATFALLHTNPVGFLPIMALGCLLGYLYERTGSLISPLTVHVVHNGFLMGVAFVFRRILGIAA